MNPQQPVHSPPKSNVSCETRPRTHFQRDSVPNSPRDPTRPQAHDVPFVGVRQTPLTWRPPLRRAPEVTCNPSSTGGGLKRPLALYEETSRLDSKVALSKLVKSVTSVGPKCPWWASQPFTLPALRPTLAPQPVPITGPEMALPDLPPKTPPGHTWTLLQLGSGGVPNIHQTAAFLCFGGSDGAPLSVLGQKRAFVGWDIFGLGL